MKIRDLMGFSIRNLWRRKLRTFLTILGVIIGAASIVIMLSLGIALNQSFEDQIGQMGSLNTITVNRSYNFNPDSKDSDAIIINDEAIATFEAIPGVEIATPIIDLQMKMVSGKYTSYLNVRGIKLELFKAQDIKTDQGRLIESTDDEMSFLFGGGVKYSLYNPNDQGGGGMMYGGYYGSDGEVFESPVDFMNDTMKASFDFMFGERRQPGVTTKRVKPYTITATGVLKEGQGEYDYSIYTTLENAKALIKEKEKYEKSLIVDQGTTTRVAKTKDEGYQTAYVQVKDMDQVKEVQDQIKTMGYEAWSLIEYIESSQKQAASIQAVLGGIGAVSLLVAALGITNTMIMSIYERTKEIGVMKVIGASLPDIKKMFLAEAAMIGFFGGLLGLLTSFLGSSILNHFSKNGNPIFGGTPGSKISIIPLWLYVLSIAFSTLVGIISGYLPAIKAMKLSVLKALRTE